MKTSVGKWDFQDAFRQAGRQDNFSDAGLDALFDYFEELENDCGIEIELDVVAICCEYTEYENLEEFQENYGTDYETIEDIEYNTQVIMIDDESFIIQDF